MLMDVQFPSPSHPLRIGTRASPLAMAQAYETRGRLMAAHDLPEEAFDFAPITTIADKTLDRSLNAIGGKGLFTKELEDALLDGRIDMAVHSMKDVATVLPEGLVIACVLPREDVRDAFVSPHWAGIDAIPEGETVGTSSLRRRAQLLNARPDLRVVEFRGNVQTRMRKLENGVAGATFLAMAGLKRLGMASMARGAIEPDEMLPAPAQGAIGIETREDNVAVRAVLAPIGCVATEARLAAERSFLKGLDGSCRTPIGGLAEIADGRMRLRGEILRPDGSERYATLREGAVADAERMGADAADELRLTGGPGFFEA